MSNIKEIRIIADVPFDYVNRMEEDGGLPVEEKAAIASALLMPSGGLTYRYEDQGYVPNSRGGQTSMYRILIEGHEAMAMGFLKRLCLALKSSGEFAKLHVAEARDIEAGGPWQHIVPAGELSGEAER